MAERKTIHKWFWVWDFEKEERWLNEMAMNGWRLASVGWCTYTFVPCEPGEYIVRLEMRPPDDGYISFMEETGAIYIGRVIQWIFFCKKAEDGPFDIFSDLDSRVAHLERIGRMLAIIGGANLAVGLLNTLGGGRGGVGALNLVVATGLIYGLGRIRGKAEALKDERQLRE